MQIADFNVARRRYEVDDPRFAGFMDNLDRINGLAERSRGFVWRLKSDADAGEALEALPDDPTLIVNLSVWETVEDLERFTFGTIHHQIYKRREEWFPALEKRHFALWRVPVGHRPDVAEAMAKLDQINRDGPSEAVFGWEALPNLRMWMEKRCG
ncbi:MAG: DUF3291 domain-containing protein [Pseudomonadota bacterium]